jgi:uncharacterized protein (DUF2225 family)
MNMKESKLIWLRQVECPLCYEEFTTENIWMNKISVLEEYPDLGKKYAGTNPLFYSVWVCPNCYYTDLRGEEFEKTGKINDEKFEEDYPILQMIAEDEDFRNPRTFGLAVKSYKLAIFVAKHKQSSLARIGTFNLRLAWLYRSIKKTEQEKRYIGYALDHYVKAFTTESEPDFGKLGPGGMHYLLGELYRQTGDLKTAVRFFQKVVNDKKMNTEPKYIKLARLQWETLREKVPEQSAGDDTAENFPIPEA